jgi:hypothetical protein
VKNTLLFAPFSLLLLTMFAGSAQQTKRSPIVAAAPSGPPQLIQQSANGVSAGLTLDVTLGASPAPGNSLIAIVSCKGGTSITGITGGGVTWAQAAHIATNRTSDIWFGHGSSGSGTTVTVTVNSSTTSRILANVSEWSGLKNAGAESTNTSSGTAQNTTTNSVTPASVNSVVVAGDSPASVVTYVSGPTNSFTRLTPTSSTVVLESAYQIETSTGTYSTGHGWSGSGLFSAAIAAFGAP